MPTHIPIDSELVGRDLVAAINDRFRRITVTGSTTVVNKISPSAEDDQAITINGQPIPGAKQSTKEFKGDYLSVKMLGLIPDARELTDFALDVGVDPTALNSPSNPFLPEDVGKLVSIAGAGAAGAWHTTTIATFVDAANVTLTDAAATTVTAAGGVMGTDNAVAFGNLLATCRTLCRRKIFFPSGWYLTTATWDLADGSVEIVGEADDNSASSVIAYVGTGVALYVHPTDLAAQTFAVNMRHLAIVTYGGATDGLKLRNLSQGIFHDISINNSGVATATRGLNLVNPNILTFTGLIITRSTGAGVTIESTGFPFDATNTAFTGGNLYQNGTVFDLRANLVHCTIRDMHVEQFTHLFYCDRSVGAANLQINGLRFTHNEVLGSTGGYDSDLINFTVTGIDTLSARHVSFCDNWAFFGTAKLNPITFAVDDTATLAMDLLLKDNLFSDIDTSLILADLNPAASILDIYEENNRKVFGSDYVLQDAANDGVEVHRPVYGGDDLNDTFRVPFTNKAGRLLTDRGASDSGVQYYPTTLTDPDIAGLLVLQSDANLGQLEISDEAFSRVMRTRAPNSGGYVNVTFAGAAAGVEFHGLVRIDDITSLYGVVEMPTLSATTPLCLDGSKIIVSKKIQIDNAGYVEQTSGFVNGHAVVWSSGHFADGGPSITFGAGVANGDMLKANVSGGTVTTMSQADACAWLGFSVGHAHIYAQPALHTHGGVTTGSGTTASGGASSGTLTGGPT